METAANVILDALKELVAIPAEASIDAYKTQVGIFYLNAMMLEYSAVGIDLGFTAVNSLSDEVTVDPAAIEGIVKNLAIEMSPAFKGSLTSPDLFQQAQSSLKILRQIAFPYTANSSYSSNLPIGSGNEYWNTTQFYDQAHNPILTENSGNIAPESAE